MDPSTNNTTSNQIPPMELPSVLPETQQGLEQPMVPVTSEVTVAQSLEQGVSQSVPVDPASSNTNLGPQPAVATSFDPAQMVSPSSSSQPSISANPTIADDTDLIEKEWVTKAKQIVEHTKDDPRLQNKEMNKVKADYLKKRYNKDLKIQEE